MAERPKLGQLLISAEVIVEGQLAAALDEQKQTGRPLGMTLVTMGFLDEETLVRTLARQLSLPIAWIRGKKIRQPVLELVPASIVGAHRCLPVRVDDQAGNKTLLLTMEDPADVSVLDQVALAAGMPVRPVLAAPSEIEESIQRHFPDLELAPPGAVVEPEAGLDRELLPGLETGADDFADEDKDDACMSSLDFPDGLSDDLAAAPDDSGPNLSNEDDDDALSYDELDASKDLDLGDDLDSVDARDGDCLEEPAPAEDEGPELVCMADVSPLVDAAKPPQASALGSVGADVILRALSQLLVEKGVIGREELIERLTKLSGRGDEDGLSKDLDAEI